ncbi:MAG: hypothetical protein ACXAEE_10710 [Candidatus Thorarchaeota archaeon]|jgi:hypothetical protein
MNEDPNSEQDEDSKPAGPVRKPFNPMMTYIYFAVAILSGYFVLYIAGYLGLTVFGLIFMVYLLQETRYVLRSYSYSFVRKASYVNVAHALFYFILLVVNGYSLSQGGGLLLLPQWELLTDWSPVFILLSTYGITNIKAMYVPDK